MLSKLTTVDVERLVVLSDRVSVRMSDEKPDAEVIKPGSDADVRALRSAMEALGPDAQMELLTLMYVGRGDFSANDRVAIAETQRKIGARSVAQMMEKSGSLSAYWRKGLKQAAGC